jgi:predicted amidophosphoribosyltransferase
MDREAVALLDVLFPPDCIACGRRGALGCGFCGAELAGPATVSWPQPAPPGLPVPWAVAAYAGSCRQFLLAYKERGAVGVARLLAVPLARSITAAAGARTARVIVVPVPSTRSAIRVRGDDVVLTLARRAAAIARRQGLPVQVLPALRHCREVADSSGLGARARATNLAGALSVRPRLGAALVGAEVVIADDLITTGATLVEAARALASCDAFVLGAATVAATQRGGRPRRLGAGANGATVNPHGT